MGVVSSLYRGYRYPAEEIISHCVWLYHRFPLSFREVEEMMLARAARSGCSPAARWRARPPPERTPRCVRAIVVMIGNPSGQPRHPLPVPGNKTGYHQVVGGRPRIFRSTVHDLRALKTARSNRQVSPPAVAL
jgi:hypothetical protein